ncbi:uncharacterized protein LOC106637322 [Copidosoma floridanum]|uniref:uncharacterized protein LOC106637322 n=1 Tax=Copidosoma floridanum TaxID=29053 RepID=UPI0006C9AC36|nr:uncharacterized protein LOC106637322 [Copidosoma floridanum]
MDYPPRYPDACLNSESSTSPYSFNVNYIYHQHQQQLDIQNMHYDATKIPSMQQRARQMRADLHENIKNSSLGSDYPTKQSLSADSMIEQPEKKGLWQSMFRSATNLLGEHLSRGTGSFIRNWTSMNSSPLSVTVVSPDLYKTLHTTGVQESMNVDAGTLFTTTAWCNSGSSTDNTDSRDETLASVLYNNDSLNGSCKVKLVNCCSVSDPSDVDKRWKEYKNMYVDCNALQQEHEEKNKPETVDTDEMSDVHLESIESIIIRDEKDVDKSANFGSTLHLNNDESVTLEEIESDLPVGTHETMQQQTTINSSPNSSVVGTMITNAYNKVVNSVTDLLQTRSCSPEPEPTALFSKRAGGYPKPKKVHAISSGRGRGRGRSQLRRSGVSQKRHRKERSRYDRTDDIKFDIENWEQMENYTEADDVDEASEDVCDFAGGVNSIHKHLLTISFEDIMPMKIEQEPKGLRHSNLPEVSSKLSFISDDEEEEEYEDDDDDVYDDDIYDYEDDNVESDESSEEEFVQFSCTNRIRLSSVSSVDSDDSFCIVFNDGNECKTSINPEAEAQVETEAEDEVEAETECILKNKSKDSDFNVKEWKPSKVRFNLKPIVHTIVHWRYAHRAARRGPWEEYARDRARFQRRVMEIGTVLKPVFSTHHRERIWNERFANDVPTAVSIPYFVQKGTLV